MKRRRPSQPKSAGAPVLVIHGGAGARNVNGDAYQEIADSLTRIAKKVYPFLQRGTSSLKAVVRATELLEDDPLYNAGKGSKIQSDGKIRMSAALMDGSTRKFSGCVNVEGIKNPIRLAEALIKENDRVLSDRGAQKFARALGLPFASAVTPRALQAFKARKAGKTGTVGAIALDLKGRLSAATSTGGRGYEYPFRVSDTPTVAGNYANAHCAVSVTGTGERIVDYAAAATVCAHVEAGRKLSRTVNELLGRLTGPDACFGMIALDSNGHFVAETATTTLIWAACTPQGFEIFKQN